MKKFGLLALLAAVLVFSGCGSSPSANAPPSESSPSRDDGIPDYPVIMYYGANIGQFPPKVRDWIMNRAYTKDKMEGAGKTNPQLRVWWSNDGNAVSTEASYIVAPGYVGA
jgi:hypothetical protein